MAKSKIKPDAIKVEGIETPEDEAAESPAKQKAELKAGSEKHKGKAMAAMKMFRTQQFSKGQK